MATAAGTKKSGGNDPSSSFAMDIISHSVPTSPTTTSFRTRTVSTPTRAKKPDGTPPTTDAPSSHTTLPISSLHDHSQTNLNDSRTRRSSTTASGVHFSIPKTFSLSSPLGFFSRRRKSIQHPPRPLADALAEVIEIGPDAGRVDANAIEENEERDRLRDAAAQALGLGLGRDSSGTPEPTPEETEVAETPSVTDKPINLYVLDPIPTIPPLLTPSPPSLISLPNSHSQMAPSIMTTITGSSDTVPPYPSTLSALKPYIQAGSSLLKFHTGSTFLTLTLSRRAKQWKLHHAVLTSPPPLTSTTHDFSSNTRTDKTRLNAESFQPRADVMQMSNGDFPPLASTRYSHLHLFRSTSPAPEDIEIDRLEINDDSVVYVAELEIAGKRDVVKVGGRDGRRTVIGSGGASVKSTGSSWHGGMKADNEVNTEEMGRTMWLLKMADGSEVQRWMTHIKSAVFTLRAERAGMAFRQHSPNGVSNVRADLDVLLSLRSQALLPNIASSSNMTMPSYTGYTAPSVETISQGISAYPSPKTLSLASPQKPPSSYGRTSFSNTPSRASSPTSNPRYAEHVGAAPSYTSPASLRTRTYPTSSSLNHGLPSLKNIFSPNSMTNGSGLGHGSGSSPGKRACSRQGSRPSSPQVDNEKDIDPISDDMVSLGDRAAALLNIFRPSSRASNSHHQRTSMTNYSTTTPPVSTTRSHGLGTPISPGLYSDETVRGKSSGAGAPSTALSVDWSMMNDSATSNTNKQISPGTPSLPPPPRNPRRPIANSIVRGNTAEATSRENKVQVNGTSHAEEDGPSPKRRSSSPHGPHTPTISSPASASIPGSSGHRGGRPPSANSMSSYASAEGDRRSSELDRGSSMRRLRTVPKMLAPPNGPPPSAPSLRARTPSGPPSPILEQDSSAQRNGGSRHEPSSSATSIWGSQHPYSNRVSGSSAMSVKTNSTGHSFLGSKTPPPPRPPPNFSPPPAPTDVQDNVLPASVNRESLISRSLRLSLVPPAGAPPTQSLPPRPDEPGYRHRRSQSNEVKSTNSLSPIPASPTPSSLVIHPFSPPPNRPLPPTPDTERDRLSSSNSGRNSLTHRLRILSPPLPASLTQVPAKDAILDSHRRLIGEPIMSYADSYPPMFLNMSDTPITPAMSHASSFLPVPSLQPEQDDAEPTPLSPPPRRNSRNSKEIRMFNHEKDDIKLPVAPPLRPQDSAVVLHHR